MSHRPELLDVLSKAIDGGIEKYNVTIPEDKKGTGFMGEITFVTLQDKQTGEEKSLVWKKIVDYPGRTGELIKMCFKNEIRFYKEIVPALRELQKDEKDVEVLDMIPTCYDAVDGEGLLLENLSRDGYQLLGKSRDMDRSHMRLICKFYGRFHGLAFAFKELRPEEHSKVTNGIVDITDFIIKAGMCEDILKHFRNYLERKEIFDAKLHKRTKMYAEKGVRIFADSIKYKGEHAVILHGDCHSNNMFFKYNDKSLPIDMKLIDFQVTKLSTPVLDLSYLIYGSGSEDIFDELNLYLKIYHDSLTETLGKFNLDSSSVYPFDTLKREWKEHCKFGIIMAILVWSVKVSAEDEIPDIGSHEDKEKAKKYTSVNPFDKIKFRNVFESLIQHAYKHDFL